VLEKTISLPVEPSAPPPHVPLVVPRVEQSRWPLVAIAVALDLVLINIAFLVAYTIRYTLKFGPFRGHSDFVPTTLQHWTGFQALLSVVMLCTLGLTGLYRLRLGREWVNECFLVGRAVLVGMSLLIVFGYFFTPDFSHSRWVLVYTLLLLVAFLGLGKLLGRFIFARLHRATGWGVRRVLVAGDTPVGKVLMQNLLRKRSAGYEVVGFVRGRGDERKQAFGRFPCLGTVDVIAQLAAQNAIDEVIIALPSASHEEIDDIRAHCTHYHVAFKLVPDLFELSLSRVGLDDVAGIPLIDVQGTALRGVNAALKRILDISVASLVLLLGSPLIGLVILAIRLDSPGPIVFRQTRVGKGGRHFICFKFRSMVHNAEALLPELMQRRQNKDILFKDKHDPRMTRVGRFIRRVSLDELPQLWNVLRGEMSLVGPRPPLPREVERYEAWHRRRLDAQPGITGLWQVSGRSALPFEEMVMMDLYYIDRWSLGLDLRILVQTGVTVFTSSGAY